MSNTPIPYPRRLYPGGIVDHTDLHARASVVVHDAEEEEEARARGFRKAYEIDPTPGGYGSSEASAAHPSVLPDEQGGDATASAAPYEAKVAAEDAMRDAAEAEADKAAAQSEAELLASLRAEAAALGLTPHHRAGVAKLREMIAAAKG